MWSSLTRPIFLQKRAIHYSLITLSKVKSIKSNDLLLEQIKRAATSKKLLEISKLHSAVMNNTHYASLYENLFEIAKNSRENVLDIRSNPEFQELCSSTIKKSRHFNNNQAISVIKSLYFFKVENNHKLFDVFYTILSNNLSSLTIGQTIFLHHLILRQDSSPLIQGLTVTLPMVLQMQLENKIDTLSFSDAMKCFEILISNNKQSSTLKKLLEYIQSQSDKLTLNDAFIIFRLSISTKIKCEELSVLQELASNILAKEMDQLTENQIRLILYALKKVNPYLKNIYDTLSQKAIEQDWPLDSLCKLLAPFNYNDHSNEDILKLVEEKILSFPEPLDEDHKINFLSLTYSLALPGFNLKPQTLQLLANCEKKIEAIKAENNFIFLICIKDLASLGYCPEKYLAQIFNQDFIDHLIHKMDKHKKQFVALNTLLKLHWTAKLELNSEHHLSSDQLASITECLTSSIPKTIFPLQSILTTGLGGEQFLHSGIWTSEGQFIDHLVVLRKGNFPIAINLNRINSSEPYNLEFDSLKEVDTPANSIKIAILIAKSKDYCRGSGQLKGDLNLKARTLAKLGYHSLIISLPYCNQLLEGERIPFIMDKINNLYKEIDNLDKSTVEL